MESKREREREIERKRERERERERERGGPVFGEKRLRELGERPSLSSPTEAKTHTHTRMHTHTHPSSQMHTQPWADVGILQQNIW